MKNILLIVTALGISFSATAKEGFTCKSKNRKPVTCESFEGAKRTHLCVKKGLKINPERVKAYCLKEKKTLAKRKVKKIKVKS